MADEEIKIEEPTVDSVRNELREAVFWSLFNHSAQKVDPSIRNGAAEDTMHRIAHGFLEFGIRSKLITADEANEYVKVIRGEQTVVDVLKKYPNANHKDD